MLFFEMSDFMREHRFEFGFGQLLDEGVEQDDFSELPEPGEKSIGMTRAFAAIHHLDAAGAKTGSQSKAQQALAQAAFRQRRKFVEQRQDQHGRQDDHEQLKGEQGAPRP